MTPHLRTARCLTAAATLSSGTAAYLATTNTPLWALPVVYIAALLAWCAQRDYATHRRILVEHERSRRTARLQELDAAGPCCQFWRHSDGAVHGPRCPRRPDPTAELDDACCDIWFVFRGDDHDAACPTRSTKSSAA